MEIIKDSRNGLASYAASRLRHESFTLIDVGCSGGIDGAWRAFGDSLHAIGIDPNVEEVERLNKSETSPDVRYEAAFVDLPANHPVRIRRGEKDYWGRNPWSRLAVARSIELMRSQIEASSNEQKTALNVWQDTTLAQERHIHLPDYFRSNGLSSIDFIKIDIDSGDFDVLQGLKDDLAECDVLALGLEVNFFGSDDPTEHTLHNTGRFMKANGFELFGLTVRTYSMAALPMRYQYRFPAESVGGRPLQGDALYARDLCNFEWRKLGSQLSAEKLIKLAAIFSLGGLPDCAAEVLSTFRARISSLMDVDLALDMLAKESGYSMRYREVIDSFEKNSTLFYPATKV